MTASKGTHDQGAEVLGCRWDIRESGEFLGKWTNEVFILPVAQPSG